MLLLCLFMFFFCSLRFCYVFVFTRRFFFSRSPFPAGECVVALSSSAYPGARAVLALETYGTPSECVAIFFPSSVSYLIRSPLIVFGDANFFFLSLLYRPHCFFVSFHRYICAYILCFYVFFYSRSLLVGAYPSSSLFIFISMLSRA